MYSAVRESVNVSAAGIVLSSVLSCSVDALAEQKLESLSCDEVLTALFTPARPQLGHYEVCTTPEPLTSVASREWKVESVPPLDAFGAAGPYDRAAVARLYGGRRAEVARGWIQRGERFEALTLISPHPDSTLTRLMPGTLVIRYIVRP
jgi:hypothetical protein